MLVKLERQGEFYVAVDNYTLEVSNYRTVRFFIHFVKMHF